MSRRDDPLFEPGVLEPLRFERSQTAPFAAKARVFSRVQQTMAEVEASGRAAMDVAQDARTAARRLSGAAFGKVALRPAWIAATALVAGGVAGAAVHAALSRPVERIVYVDRFVGAPSAPPQTSAAILEETNPAPTERALRTHTSGSVASGAGAPSVFGLAEERALLDQARKALQAGDNGETERVVESHARRFPSGLLVEEREALAIKAQVNSGRRAEALARAEKFRERFPKSLFGPSVREALER